MQPSLQSSLKHFYHLKKKPIPVSSHSFSPNPQPQPVIFFLPVDLPLLNISYKWNHTVCEPL